MDETQLRSDGRVGTCSRFAPVTHPDQPAAFAYVGSWTQEPFGVGGGGGITVLEVDRATGTLTALGRTSSEFDNLNAGYLCVAPGGQTLFATNEIKNRDGQLGVGGSVLSFDIDHADGAISYRNAQPSMGVNPAYITIDATGAFVLAANHGDYVPALRVNRTDAGPQIEQIYDDGTVTVLPVRGDGSLAPALDVAILDRLSGVDTTSQRSPHAHSVNFDPGNLMLLVCDKGTDRLYTFRLDAGSGRLIERRVFPTAPGISPRHSVFHPFLPYVFVIHERESSMAVYRYSASDGGLEHLQTIATIPPDFSGRNAPADIRIHPGGRFIYGSNRGHDSIAVFEFDEASERLNALGTVDCGREAPRGISFDPFGRYLYSANQASDNIAVFGVDASTGALNLDAGDTAVLKPACIKFLDTA